MWVLIKIVAGVSPLIFEMFISNNWFLQLQQMQSTTVQERNSFGMHNYGNHKAYLAVFVVSAVNFLSDGCSFLQLHIFPLEKQKVR